MLALYSYVDKIEPELGRTALHFAVRGLSAGPPRNRENDHLECVRHLLRFHAAANIPDKLGRTAKDYAGTPKIAKYLDQVSFGCCAVTLNIFTVVTFVVHI